MEVAPAFPYQGGGYFVCDAHEGGRYKWVHPEAEIAALDGADMALNGNVRKLTRILKQWQRHCNVPIKSFQIEALVMEVLPRLSYGDCDEFWFDWLVRDALGHMISRANGWFTMPVTGEVIQLGDAWLSKASSAYGHALRSAAASVAASREESNDMDRGLLCFIERPRREGCPGERCAKARHGRTRPSRPGDNW